MYNRRFYLAIGITYNVKKGPWMHTFQDPLEQFLFTMVNYVIFHIGDLDLKIFSLKRSKVGALLGFSINPVYVLVGSESSC